MPVMESANYYEVLGISRGATADEIASAWRQAARLLHPDVGGNAAMFRMAAEAHEVLADPVRRADYDLSLDYATATADDPTDEWYGCDDPTASYDDPVVVAADDWWPGPPQAAGRRWWEPFEGLTLLALAILTGLVWSARLTLGTGAPITFSPSLLGDLSRLGVLFGLFAVIGVGTFWGLVRLPFRHRLLCIGAILAAFSHPAFAGIGLVVGAVAVEAAMRVRRRRHLRFG